MSTTTTTRAVAWTGWILAVVVAGVLAVVLLRPGGLLGSVLGSTTESRDAAVVTAVTTEEQVVLVTLGIEGLREESATANVLGLDVPWSERTSYIKYAFDAKLGIDGEDVAIDKVADDSFVITIPEFIFIGHDNEDFDLIVENNGVLSLITPEIDEVRAVSDILDDGVRQERLDANEKLLQEQAATFYRGIVAGVAPEATVEFRFEKGPLDG